MNKVFILAIFILLIACGSSNEYGYTSVELETEATAAESINTDEMEMEHIFNIDDLSLEEKIGQMFVLRLPDNMTVLTEDFKKLLYDKNVGGVIFFSGNIKTIEQTKKLIADLSETKIPLFLGIDEEGGVVTRTSSLAIEKPSSSLLSEGKYYEYGDIIGKYLAELGFNTNFAPVADIEGDNYINGISNRTFSSDANIVSTAVFEMVKAFKDNGLYPAIKHYPGHGDAFDTHDGFAFVPHTLDELKNREFIPFAAGIEADTTFVMIAHIAVPNVTGNDEPAIFSKTLIDILKNDLNFNGLVITDALDMGAIVKYYSKDKVAVDCIKAGVDMLTIPEDFHAAYNGLLNAVRNGEISEDRINESVMKILKTKESLIKQ